MDARIIDLFLSGIEKGDADKVKAAIKIAEGEPDFGEYDRLFAEIEAGYAEQIRHTIASGMKLFMWKIRKNFQVYVAVVTAYTKERAIEKILEKIEKNEKPLFVDQIKWDFKVLLEQMEPDIYSIDSLIIGTEEVSDFVHYDC